MARYYHPTHGVFVSLDPDPGDEDDILTQNGYTYANNNPIMIVDPDGKRAIHGTTLLLTGKRDRYAHKQASKALRKSDTSDGNSGSLGKRSWWCI